MLEYFTAVSDLVLAGVLQETNRFEEARPVFEKCQQMFPRWGATDLAAECADALQRGPSVRLRGLP